jgi:hypothetical protein
LQTSGASPCAAARVLFLGRVAVIQRAVISSRNAL